MPLVLLVSYSGAFGGAERLLVDFAEGLDGSLCLACPEGSLADAARTNGIRVFPLRARSLRLRGGATVRLRAAASLLGHRSEVRRIAAGLDPNALVAWGMRSAIACLLAPVHRCPVVFQHNDLAPGPAVAALVRSAAARADLVVTLSDAIAADLDPDGRLAGRLQVIHPGIDVEQFPSSAPDRPAEVLVLGALVPWKRPDLALEACARARRRVPQLSVRFVGAPLTDADAGLVARLRARASEPDLAGAVDFAGAVPDGRRELTRSSCLLHCAEREPFGMAVLEALAAGRPAVVPASAGPAEIVDETCGVRYPAGDAAGAADALVSVLEDPARGAALGAAGRARARSQFNRAAALERYRAAVGSVLGTAQHTNAAPEKRSLALVTVTHNSAPELRALLASVRRHLPEAHVVVADCASSDDSVAVARSWEEPVTVIELDNVGFGRACNRALAEVDEPVAVLVNPDVELVDGSIRRLADAALDAGNRILAPAVLTPSGDREDSVHPVPASVPDLLRALVPYRALPSRVAGSLAPWRDHRPRRVGWAVGCALAARTDTLRRLGPFDEQIFLYGEDLDLGLRAADAGIETWFWPAARILHHRAHSTAAAFGGEPVGRLLQARSEVVWRRLGPRRGRLDDLAQMLTFASRLVAKRALGRAAERERGQLGAMRRLRRDRG